MILDKNYQQYSDPNWAPPEVKEWDSATLRELELDFGRRGYPIFCLEFRQWLEDKFDEHFKDPNYKSQYFDQTEFDRIRRKRGLI